MLQIRLFLSVLGFWPCVSQDNQPPAFTVQLPETLFSQNEDHTGKGLDEKIDKVQQDLESHTEITNNLKQYFASLQTTVNKTEEDQSKMSKTLTAQIEALSKRLDDLEKDEENIEKDEDNIEKDEENSNPCKEGYNYVPSPPLCLKQSSPTDKRSWADSQTECETMGASIVKLDTFKRHKAVVKYLDHEIPDGYKIWVEKGYSSTLAKAEPDKVTCDLLKNKDDGRGWGELEYLDCSRKFRFMCEFVV